MESIACSSNGSTSETFILGGEEAQRTYGECIGEVPQSEKHESLDASEETKIMEREIKKEKQELRRNISLLEAQCKAKAQEIASLEQVLYTQDEQIAQLSEIVTSLQQNGQVTEVTFENKLETIDKELNKTKDNICQAEEHYLKKKNEIDSLRSEPKLFNAKEDFDHPGQASWFDTLIKNTECVEIKMYPVCVQDLEAMKEKSNYSFEKLPDQQTVDSSEKFRPANSKISQAAQEIGAMKKTQSEKLPANPKISEAAQDTGAMKKTSNSTEKLPPSPTISQAALSRGDVIKPSDFFGKLPVNPKISQTAEHSQEKIDYPPIVQFVPAVNSSAGPPPYVPAAQQSANRFRKARKEKRQPVSLPDVFVPTPNSVAAPPPPPPAPAQQNANRLRKASKETRRQPSSRQPLPAIFVPTVYSPGAPPPVSSPTQQNAFSLGKTPKGKSQQVPPPPPPPMSLPGNTTPGSQSISAGEGDRPTVNAFSKAAKANGYTHQRPLPHIPVGTVLDGSQLNMPLSFYPADAFTHCKERPFQHVEQQGFLSRTFGRWFGFW